MACYLTAGWPQYSGHRLPQLLQTARGSLQVQRCGETPSVAIRARQQRCSVGQSVSWSQFLPLTSSVVTGHCGERGSNVVIVVSVGSLLIGGAAVAVVAFSSVSSGFSSVNVGHSSNRTHSDVCQAVEFIATSPENYCKVIQILTVSTETSGHARCTTSRMAIITTDWARRSAGQKFFVWIFTFSLTFRGKNTTRIWIMTVLKNIWFSTDASR